MISNTLISVQHVNRYHQKSTILMSKEEYIYKPKEPSKTPAMWFSVSKLKVVNSNFFNKRIRFQETNRYSLNKKQGTEDEISVDFGITK